MTDSHIESEKLWQQEKEEGFVVCVINKWCQPECVSVKEQICRTVIGWSSNIRATDTNKAKETDKDSWNLTVLLQISEQHCMQQKVFPSNCRDPLIDLVVFCTPSICVDQTFVKLFDQEFDLCTIHFG